MTMWRRYVPALVLLPVLVLEAPSMLAGQAEEGQTTGVVPEGIWILNQARSRQYAPGAHILWIIEDDGRRLSWVSFQTDTGQNVLVTSWDGCYDGEPVEVKGTGMVSRVESPAPGQIINYGRIPDIGTYSEECEVMAQGRRFRCELTITTEEGSTTYIDDFDWHSPGPAFVPAAQRPRVDAASRAACS